MLTRVGGCGVHVTVSVGTRTIPLTIASPITINNNCNDLRYNIEIYKLPINAQVISYVFNWILKKLNHYLSLHNNFMTARSNQAE